MKLDMATLVKLQSMGIKSVVSNDEGQINCVEFFPEPAELQPPAQFVLPDGTPMDKAMQEAARELAEADSEAQAQHEQREREKVLFHSS